MKNFLIGLVIGVLLCGLTLLVLVFAVWGCTNAVALVVVVTLSVVLAGDVADVVAFATVEAPVLEVLEVPAAPLATAAPAGWVSVGAAAASSSAANGSLPVSPVSCADPGICCWVSEAMVLVAWMCDAILDTAIPLKSARLGYLPATHGPLLMSNKYN